ncbi:thermonuclease family protein [Candidatus Saccharibacteria bacterium]|nr:thermonuclease family protein [Candidatus Saccharibacteria bacterium]
MEQMPSRKVLWFWWLVLIMLVVAAFVLMTRLGGLPRSVVTNDPGLYAIDHFVDGDTVAVNMNGTVETVRMIGVDTPETHRPNSPVQCYGPEAAAYTKQLIGNSKVRLQADPLDTNRDRYNRLLRYVYLPDGRMVETELIRNGYGFAYTQFPFEKSNEFAADQETAKQQSRGLWAACEVRTEDNGRQQTNDAS